MITPQQVELVQQSWQKVLPIKVQTAELFYDRLFELDPDLRSLFRGDLAEQQRKLMAMLDTVVRRLHALDDGMLAAIRTLGIRHEEHGVLEQDYETVGAALLWTLEQGLGDDFTAEVRAAWNAAYTLIAETMQNPLLTHEAPTRPLGTPAMEPASDRRGHAA